MREKVLFSGGKDLLVRLAELEWRVSDQLFYLDNPGHLDTMGIAKDGVVPCFGVLYISDPQRSLIVFAFQSRTGFLFWENAV
jgi:hypothetical protein